MTNDEYEAKIQQYQVNQNALITAIKDLMESHTPMPNVKYYRACHRTNLLLERIEKN
jgi:hypothetical protein